MRLPEHAHFVAIVACSLFAFVACGGESAASEPIIDPLAGATAEAATAIELRDIAFSEDVLTIDAGRVTQVAISNAGSLRHDFTIQRVSADVSASGQQKRGKFDVHVDLQKDQSATLLLRVTEPGEYTFFCSVPGHRSAGMEGTLVVNGSGAGG
ncbi:MAG TPA: cupredoxin domain-containing protein [Dehalococcoidia bacterium]|jgi:uncharacterized cupredoxin-like copper-binding protein|nr:cupredoxin domain-containing protein [Dehalococcoidia bacterium]